MFRIEFGLIAEQDEHAGTFGAQRIHAGTQRRAEPESPIDAVDAAYRQVFHLRGNGIGVVADNDHRVARPSFDGEPRSAVHERFTAINQKLFGLPEPLRRTRGENDNAVCGNVSRHRSVLRGSSELRACSPRNAAAAAP